MSARETPTPTPTPAPFQSVWATPAGGVAFAAATFPVCALLASRGVVVVLALSAMFSLWRLVAIGGLGRIARGPLAAFVGLLLVWALATLGWTLAPAAAASKLATVAGILLGALILTAAARDADRAARHAIGTAAVGGFLLGIVILGIDLVGEQIIAGSLRAVFSPDSAPLAPEAVNQGACILAVWVWPVALILARRAQPLLAALAIGITGVLVFGTPSTSAGLAIVVAGAGGAAVWAGGATAARSTGAAVAALTILAPLFPVSIARPERLAPFLSDAALPELHRLHLWEFVANGIFQHPFAGWGFFASRFMPGGAVELIPGVPLMALHPHNATLQTWLELGVPGAVLLAGGLYFLTARIGSSDLDRLTRAALIAILLAALAIANLSYGLWQSWWLSALGLTGAVAVCLGNAAETRQN